MNLGKAFAVLMIVLQIIASLGYFVNHDIRRGVYWAAAAVITASVTF